MKKIDTIRTRENEGQLRPLSPAELQSVAGGYGDAHLQFDLDGGTTPQDPMQKYFPRYIIC